jgi:hypothetical protein
LAIGTFVLVPPSLSLGRAPGEMPLAADFLVFGRFGRWSGSSLLDDADRAFRRVACFPAVVKALPVPSVAIEYLDGNGDSSTVMNVTSIDLPGLRQPVGVTRRLILLGLIPSFAAAVVVAAHWLYEAKKECAGGAFSSAFSSGFDVRHCDLVVKRVSGDEIVRIPLPRQTILDD